MRSLRLTLIALLITSQAWAGASRTFDGASGNINYGSDANLDNQQPYTISIWGYPNSEGEGAQAFFVSKVSAAGAGSSLMRFGAGTNALRFVKSGSTNLVSISIDNEITLGTWSFFSIDWDGSDTATNVQLTINEVEVGYATQTNGATLASDAAHDLLTGGNSADDRTFDGQLCYFQFHDRQITSAERAEIRWKPGMVPQNLILFNAHWGDSPEQDLSGNGFSGTVNGAGTVASADGPPVGFGGLLPL